MGMEQGGYAEEYGAGNGGDFTYGYGGGGDEFAVDYASYYGGNGNGGAPIDWGFDTTSWPTLDSVVADQAFGVGDDFYYGYGAGEGDASMQIGAGSSDLFGSYFDFYSAQGYDDYTAMSMAAQAASEGSIITETYEQAAPPELTVLPELQQYFALPYNPNYLDPWQTFYTPDFDQQEFPYYPLPYVPEKLGPCPTADGLPGYCPQGKYHPTWDPCACVAFPSPPSGPTTTPASRPPPTSPSSGAPAPASRPRPSAPPLPLQGAGCVPKFGEWYNPKTGRCELLPKCPTGYVFDPIRGGCIRSAQVSPLPGAKPGGGPLPGPGAEGETDIMAELKKFPWWVWLALAGGLFLLTRDDEGGRKTTVTYRRR